GCGPSWTNAASDGSSGGSSAVIRTPTSGAWKTNSTSYVCRPSFFERQLEPPQVAAQRADADRDAQPLAELGERGIPVVADQLANPALVRGQDDRPSGAGRAWGNRSGGRVPLLEPSHPRRADRVLVGDRSRLHPGLAVGPHALTQVHRVRTHREPSECSLRATRTQSLALH